MRLADVSVSKGTFTFDGTASQIEIPLEYRFMFKEIGTFDDINVCGMFAIVDDAEEPYVVIDSVIIDDDKVYVNLDLSYVDTVSLARQLEARLGI